MITIYSGRGMLIESQGPTWMWGSASEHNVLYQYTLSAAQNLFVGLMQTESPYFQPLPVAPAPFAAGIFPGDPTFKDCSAGSLTCAMSWALQILDSSSIYIYSAGFYSWFSKYSQACVDTGNCQDRAVKIEKSTGIWLYNLATKGIVEMISPLGETPTYASNNVNGYLSSILGWLEGSQRITGDRNFTGFQLFQEGTLAGAGLTPVCETACYQVIKCDDIVSTFGVALSSEQLDGGNTTVEVSVCASSCGTALSEFHDSIANACAASPNLVAGAPLISAIDSLWSGWNETCLVDISTGKLCNGKQIPSNC